MRGSVLLRIVCAAASVATCGGGASPSAPSVPDNPNRFTISAAGVMSPTELVVAPGARVLFINNHAQRHQMSSDPHPEHNDCPAINQVGLLTQGQSRETGNLVATGTCGVHDHENPDNRSLRGRIVIR